MKNKWCNYCKSWIGGGAFSKKYRYCTTGICDRCLKRLKKREEQMKEANVRNNIIMHASKIGWTLFNNPQGRAWVGKYNNKTRCVENPRAITFGFGAGTSDLIGLRPITITPDMLGKTIAQFVAVEVKKDKNGKYKETEGQKKFGAWVISKGGHYVCADKEEDLI